MKAVFTAEHSKARGLGVKVAVILLLVSGVILAFAYLPVGAWLLDLVEWMQGAGAMGVAVFAGTYVVATTFLFPASILTSGAGLAYGPLLGTLLVSPISVVAASVAFFVARFVARDWVARKVVGDTRFQALDAAVADGGFKIVLLMRMSPLLPFNVLNYAFGLTNIRFRDYVLGSWLGMLPGTFLYVYVGSLVTSTSELLTGRGPDLGAWESALYWGGLLATVGVTVVVTRMARRATANL